MYTPSDPVCLQPEHKYYLHLQHEMCKCSCCFCLHSVLIIHWTTMCIYVNKVRVESQIFNLNVVITYVSMVECTASLLGRRAVWKNFPPHWRPGYEARKNYCRKRLTYPIEAGAVGTSKPSNKCLTPNNHDTQQVILLDIGGRVWARVMHVKENMYCKYIVAIVASSCQPLSLRPQYDFRLGRCVSFQKTVATISLQSRQ